MRINSPPPTQINPVEAYTSSAQFGFDSDGRRVSATFDGITYQHVWDDSPVNGYTLARNRIIAQTDVNHAASYFIGSTRGLISGGTLTQSYSYDAFGTLL